MAHSPSSVVTGNRLAWIDIMKGISILLIVFFHFFSAYDNGRYPWPFGLFSFPDFIRDVKPDGFFQTLGAVVEGCCAILAQRGPNAVGVFLILSGFGLTYSLAKGGKVEEPSYGWFMWYRRRLLRLYPMYWVAHLILLISPFVVRKDPIDYRIVLSLLGERAYPAETMFYYLVPSWWFLGLLIQLYLVFPLLLRLLRKLDSFKFLILCCTFTAVTRYLLFAVLRANGNYYQGAFFGARLWEFAVGMVLAVLYRRRPSQVEEGLFSFKILLAGITVYTAGLYCKLPSFTFAFADGLQGTGFFVIVGFAARLFSRVPVWAPTLSLAGAYSNGIYLLHHPYVLYAGDHLRGGGMILFVISGWLICSLLGLFGIPLEWYVNRLSGRLLDPSRPAADTNS